MGCQAAQAIGWSALCGAVSIAGQAQSMAERVVGVAGAVQSAGPLPLALLLVAGLAGLALAWQGFLWVSQIIFRFFPVVLGAVVLWVMFSH